MDGIRKFLKACVLKILRQETSLIPTLAGGSPLLDGKSVLNARIQHYAYSHTGELMGIIRMIINGKPVESLGRNASGLKRIFAPW